MAKASPRTKVADLEVRKRLIDALKAGAYRETAALHAGISVSTFYRWMKEGEAAIAADIPAEESHHRQVWEAVQNAEASGELHLLATIKAATAKNWQAAAWMLERKNPSRWGRHDRVEHSGSVVAAEIAVPQTEQARIEVAAILQQAGALQTEEQ